MDREDLIRQIEAELAREPTPREEPLDMVNGAMRSFNGTFWLHPDRHFRADGRERIDNERLERLIAMAHQVIAALGAADLVVALAAMRPTRRLLDEIEHELVAIARSYSWSWNALGGVLGVNASSVQRRFARDVVPPRKRRRYD